jgi:hypothetical protein
MKANEGRKKFSEIYPGDRTIIFACNADDTAFAVVKSCDVIANSRSYSVDAKKDINKPLLSIKDAKARFRQIIGDVAQLPPHGSPESMSVSSSASPPVYSDNQSEGQVDGPGIPSCVMTGPFSFIVDGKRYKCEHQLIIST